MLKFLDDCCKSYSLEYDFLYLPMDFRKKGNLGYAFVNFTSGVAALGFSKTLHNYKWETACTERGPITSRNLAIRPSWGRSQQWLSDARVCVVGIGVSVLSLKTLSRLFPYQKKTLFLFRSLRFLVTYMFDKLLQGKEALISRFKNSSFCCDRLDFLPVVLDPPRNGSDPNPCAPLVLGKLNRLVASSKAY
ncbi:UNVERIFIED_CONTAM: protein MEI2-like 1 [Sesamum latifolium]|uniref:Protein MEI2-like 1 n=1 Tax=Sesamum latifolium TaxID=2727402 RepID=A0AAW2W878_9LAMI